MKESDQLEILISNRILDYKEKERLKKEQERIQKAKEEQIRRDTKLNDIDPVEYELPTDELPAPAATFDKIEFIAALRYMADGKNPFSGQRFPLSSSLNNVDFVRVLYRVIEELEIETHANR